MGTKSSPLQAPVITRLSNGSVGANFALRRTQNLLQGTCSENGLGANEIKFLLQQSKYLLCGSNRSKYLLPVANPLICQNDMEEPPKCTILTLNIRNSLGVAPRTPSKWYGTAPKMHHFKVKISKFPGGRPTHIPHD